MFRSIALGIVMAGIASSAMAQDYVGTWGGGLEECRDPDRQGVIILDRTSLRGYEHRCEFRDIAEKSGIWTTRNNACEGEGETWTNTMRFSVTNKVLTLATTQGGKTRSSKYVRCPR